jgi:hypothetical protein
MPNKLMDNYGWVQNTSNLSTVRDTIDLVPEHGIRHIDLREKIKEYRESQNNLPKRWTWDARCRIKAIHAIGLVKLDRHIQGYELTALGRRLKACEKSTEIVNGLRALSDAEIEIFKEGLLSNPPVIRVLELLNEDRRSDNKGLSKYDIGRQLGFVGDVGFTHIDPYWVIANGHSFNNKEGDADKWARTILSWLSQVGWATDHGNERIFNRNLKLYSVIPDVDGVLRYDASRVVRNVASEMLCSDHHAFPKLVQKRRVIILNALNESPLTINKLQELLKLNGIEASETACEFEILNLTNAGFRIENSAGYYKLKDNIIIDSPPFTGAQVETPDETESLIEEMVVKYERTIPPRLIDHLIRFGYNGTKGAEFEAIVAEYFRFLGYESEYLGQGRGRVTDILVKYKHPTIYANSYAIIVDAKATSSAYSFPASDKRKMKEYINTHGPQLLAENIPRHAFSFVSSRFVADYQNNLQEIENVTNIKGCAITVLLLLEVGDKIIRQEIRIPNIYEFYTSNMKL